MKEDNNRRIELIEEFLTELKGFVNGIFYGLGKNNDIIYGEYYNGLINAIEDMKRLKEVLQERGFE